jgi:hypothetical protein
MSDDSSFSYKPVKHGKRWVIEATDQDGATSLMTCGANPTLEEVRARIRFLQLDDDKIDAKSGKPRKFQS